MISELPDGSLSGAVTKALPRSRNGTFSPPIVAPDDNVGDTIAAGINACWRKVVPYRRRLGGLAFAGAVDGNGLDTSN
jgi:hypothetical protein